MLRAVPTFMAASIRSQAISGATIRRWRGHVNRCRMSDRLPQGSRQTARCTARWLVAGLRRRGTIPGCLVAGLHRLGTVPGWLVAGLHRRGTIAGWLVAGLRCLGTILGWLVAVHSRLAAGSSPLVTVLHRPTGRGFD